MSKERDRVFWAVTAFAIGFYVVVLGLGVWLAIAVSGGLRALLL